MMFRPLAFRILLLSHLQCIEKMKGSFLCRRQGSSMENDAREDDWIVDDQGFYIATRSFLMRRGYCCGNQCRNCPYVNWRHSSTWMPVPAEMVQVKAVAHKVLEAVRQQLAYIEQSDSNESRREENAQHDLSRYYRLLLVRWHASSERDR